ncbi:MAG: hypothetical protein UY52_C0018G0005 [Parcubacteria group bacterium GW2011_GWC2_49_9]|nr:MAG: hypothetical protein UY52_C0018G0005 [Parcubacteria group bacterium GW2011_GWC2_49_9]
MERFGHVPERFFLSEGASAWQIFLRIDKFDFLT